MSVVRRFSFPMRPFASLCIPDGLGCPDAITPEYSYRGISVIHILHGPGRKTAIFVLRHSIFFCIFRTRAFLCAPSLGHCSACFQAKLFAGNDAADIAAGLAAGDDLLDPAQSACSPRSLGLRSLGLRSLGLLFTAKFGKFLIEIRKCLWCASLKLSEVCSKAGRWDHNLFVGGDLGKGSVYGCDVGAILSVCKK